MEQTISTDDMRLRLLHLSRDILTSVTVKPTAEDIIGEADKLYEWVTAVDGYDDDVVDG